MEMDNTVQAVKKYWVWALGAVAVIFVASRFGGGGGEVDDSGNLSGSLYDPNLLANNLAMSQVSAGIMQAQIVADAQNNIAGWNAIEAGFAFAANANSDFQAGQIASYQAVKDVSISASKEMGGITQAGLFAGAESTAAFHNMVGESSKAAAAIVGGVANANAQSQMAVANMFSKFASYGAF
jgi:hypothetical protein